ncbi:hypothetical protein RRG08_051607 [Elysia crispata]|uniref:Uncharacterized protein n=1 Tax=Elysia crispata TaxID=231223 RepID=A0AAE1A2E6_9GAST|nr:hypothetical protein RRG08_051607 [Elysia crispata]
MYTSGIECVWIGHYWRFAVMITSSAIFRLVIAISLKTYVAVKTRLQTFGSFPLRHPFHLKTKVFLGVIMTLPAWDTSTRITHMRSCLPCHHDLAGMGYFHKNHSHAQLPRVSS